jgi:hypothetical protein
MERWERSKSEGIGSGEVRRIATRRRLLLRAAGLLALLAPARHALAQGKPKAAAAKETPWDDRWELLVQLEIAEQPSGGRYHRPYVAVWVEDTDGVPVRTLSLWVQNTGRGPRWIPDLRRWFRGERLRQLVDGGDLVATVSSATRMPGAYKLVWNGKDDQNKPVRQGRYTLCIEAAREHGTYQILRKDVTVGPKPLRAQLGGNVEIKSASVDYRLRK